MKSIPRYLLFKYLRFDKDQPFITLSKILAFLGVSIGLCVLLVAMAIMNGFDKEFERKLFTMNYPISILPRFGTNVDEKLLQELRLKFPNLIFSPYISTQVIARNDFKLEGGVLFGVNFEDEKKINEIINAALENKDIQDFEILIGNGLKNEFNLTFDDKLTLIFSNLNANGLSLIPQIKRFDVKASFSSGLLAYDKAYMYTDIKSLAKILSYPQGSYDGLHVYSKNPFKDVKLIEEFVGTKYISVGWWEQNGNFFAALALEKRALFIVLMLIILVASLNIVSSLLMIVMNRRNEIALLLSLGVSKIEIKKTFFSLGFLIGGSGIVVGMILAAIVLYVLGNFDIISLPSDVYGMSKLPLELSIVDFLATILGAIIIIVLSSYYPAKKATQVNILDTLRNE
ncbi:ABC transporter permease [Campylobacter insulaenigrae]|uniref:ABC transporter permease n=1 Tax=Campylobacter insulaenigrae TaxID=260714 RepID=UPI002152D119|nr:ABC transporter permease [Campylobacter insulaenigrae]MCR6577075.1 ABC transporter permease [Campylobacter insulaenigrae]MCR6578207.1 ABC transporter permease [Campylobacter insulaenigrae]